MSEVPEKPKSEDQSIIVNEAQQNFKATMKVDDVEMFNSPPKMDDSSDSSGLSEAIQDKKFNANAGLTPAITKLRQSRTEFKVFSPSDQLVSPCTRKIDKCRLAGTFSQPQMFRSRVSGYATVGSSKMRNNGTVAPACTPQRLQLDEEVEDVAGTEQQ